MDSFFVSKAEEHAEARWTGSAWRNAPAVLWKDAYRRLLEPGQSQREK
jgi:hypothetical protein